MKFLQFVKLLPWELRRMNTSARLEIVKVGYFFLWDKKEYTYSVSCSQDTVKKSLEIVDSNNN